MERVESHGVLSSCFISLLSLRIIRKTWLSFRYTHGEFLPHPARCSVALPAREHQEGAPFPKKLLVRLPLPLP